MENQLPMQLGSSHPKACQPSLSRGFPQGRKKAQSFLSAAQEAFQQLELMSEKLRFETISFERCEKGREDVAISFQTCLLIVLIDFSHDMFLSSRGRVVSVIPMYLPNIM